MINRKLIQEEQAMRAVENGEFESDMLTSCSKVVLILTQDWCSQWQHMKSWVYRLDFEEDIDIYELEYNKVGYFDQFRAFKEREWGNDAVPYLRFYKNGVLYRECNYISEGQFLEVLSSF